MKTNTTEGSYDVSSEVWLGWARDRALRCEPVGSDCDFLFEGDTAVSLSRVEIAEPISGPAMSDFSIQLATSGYGETIADLGYGRFSDTSQHAKDRS